MIHQAQLPHKTLWQGSHAHFVAHLTALAERFPDPNDQSETRTWPSLLRDLEIESHSLATGTEVDPLPLSQVWERVDGSQQKPPPWNIPDYSECFQGF